MTHRPSWIVRSYRIVAVSCAVAAFTLGTIASVQDGVWFWVLLASAVVPTAGAVGIPMYAERAATLRATDAAGEAEKANEQMRMAMGRVLTPLTYLLGEISDARPRSANLELWQGQMRQAVVSAAEELVRAEQARACYFRIVRTRGEPRSLRFVAYYGRAQPAEVDLVDDAGLGAEAFAAIDQGGVWFYPELGRSAPAHWRDPDGRYRSLIGVPVVTEGSAFGLLTVDTESPHQLSDSDAELVYLLAKLLAVALNR